MRKEPQRGKIIWSRSHSKQMVELGFSPTQPDSINRAFNHHLLHSMGLPGGASGKEPACQCKRHKRPSFDPWVGKISWRRAWQPTPVFLPGETQGQRSLVGYSPWGCKESGTTGRLPFLSFYSFFWGKKWQRIPVFLPGESHGRKGLVDCGLWGCKESDMTKKLTHTHTQPYYYTSGISRVVKF